MINSADLPKIAASVQDSVVSITTGSGEGSGVILSADGYVLTNNHVVAAAAGDTVRVVFADGKSATAKIVGTDPKTDLAVVKASGVSRPQGGQVRRQRRHAGRRHGARHGQPARPAGFGDRRHHQRPGPHHPGRQRQQPAAGPAAAWRQLDRPACSRPTPRSTRATPAARWSTPAAR